MSKKLATNVTVEGTTYEAGSTVPKDVADKIDHPRAWSTDDDAPSGDSDSTDVDDKGYASLKVADLKAEIEKRNDGREDDAKLSTEGNKGDLVAALEADDAKASDEA